MSTARRIATLTAVLAFAGIVTLALVPGPARASSPGLLDPSSLTKHSGDWIETTDNAVIENLEIHGHLRIKASNVTVRNVWVYTKGFWVVYVESGSATFEHVEIGHPEHINERGIGGDNITAKFLDIHHVEDGIKLGENVVYDSVKVHTLASPNSSPHADAVQDDGGARNAVVRNSSLSAASPLLSGNAAVLIKSDLGASRNITFENNYLNGGGYMVFVRDGGHGMPQDVTFRNNRIGPNFVWGLLSADGPVAWTGNVWASNGEPAEVGGQSPPATTPTTTPPATTTPTTAAATTSTTKAPTTTSTTSTTSTTQAHSEDLVIEEGVLVDQVAVAAASNQSPPDPQSQIPPTDELEPIYEAQAAAEAIPGGTSSLMIPVVALFSLVLWCYIYVRRSRINEERSRLGS